MNKHDTNDRYEKPVGPSGMNEDLQDSIDEMEQSATPPVAKSRSKETKPTSFVWEVLKFAVLALIIVVPIRAYVASPFLVSGGSMDPTFGNGDYLIVDEISYRLEDPKRGDVIVFRYPNDQTKFFIKRVIGLPTETVIIKDGQVSIKNDDLPGGFPVNEPYVAFPKYDTLEVTLGDSEYFVMGDNRDASADSRLWGPLPKELITGRALVRLFPLTEIDFFPGEHNY